AYVPGGFLPSRSCVRSSRGTTSGRSEGGAFPVATSLISPGWNGWNGRCFFPAALAVTIRKRLPSPEKAIPRRGVAGRGRLPAASPDGSFHSLIVLPGRVVAS